MADVEVLADPDALAAAAARRVTSIVQDAVTARGTCSLVLAGGSTPLRLYRMLSREPHRSRIDWSRVRWFWGDERAVPPSHPDSNYRAAREALVSHVPVAPGSVHRIAGEMGAEPAAIDYDRRLRDLLGASGPRFDLVLLGVGRDGHTASLFPATPDLSPGDRWAMPTLAPSAPRERVSLTLRALNSARTVLFLAQGEGKAAVLRAVLAGSPELPAARISPPAGTVLWMIDEAAASGGAS